MKKDRSTELLNSKIKPLILKLSIPTIVSMLITAIYNFADTYFVSGVEHSQEAISAVGVIFSFMAIIQAFGFFFGHGAGSFMARLLGQNKKDEAKTYAVIGFLGVFLCGIIITIFGLIFLEPLTHLLTSNKDQNVFIYAKDYLFWILLGAPFMASSNTMNNYLRYQGKAFLAMLGIGSGAILNIIFDPFLIAKYGVSGAGMSTFISQMIGFAILFICVNHKDNIQINLKNICLKKEIFHNIAVGGFPSLARQGLNAVSLAVLNIVTINFSVDALAAMTVVNRIMSFAISVTLGIGQGFQPVCGTNYGAKKFKRVKDGFVFTTILAVSTLIVFTLISVFAGEYFLKIFADSSKFANFDEYLRIGKELLLYQTIAIPLFGFTTVANITMQTTGKSFRATILAIGRQALFFIPALFILRALWGFKGVEFAQMIADIMCFVVAVPLTISVFKEFKKEMPEEEQSISVN